MSVDSTDSHKKFREKYNLNFILVSDTSKEISKKYGVLKPTGTSERKTFLIGKDGKIKYIWTEVDVSRHAEDVKKKIDELEI